MPIPFNTTTITVTRTTEPIDYDEWGDAPLSPDPLPVAAGVRAVITTPSASTQLAGGDRIVFRATMRCDSVDLQAGDTVTDLTTGQSWVAQNVIPNDWAFSFLIVQLVDSQGAAGV